GGRGSTKAALTSPPRDPLGGRPMRFEDKVCLVTGGGSGIGRATCLRLASQGGRVVVVDLGEGGGGGAVRQIAEGGGQAVFARADVSSSEQVQAAVGTAVGRWGRIDVVVNDAAVMSFKLVVGLSEADWDRVLGVNLRGVFLVC